MELIFLLVIVILTIKLVQRDGKRLSRQPEDYQRGYWDGVRDAQNGRAKIEDSDGQVRLVINSQAASSQSTSSLLISNEEEKSAVSSSTTAASSTDAAPIEEGVSVPVKEAQITDRKSTRLNSSHW